MKNTKQNRELLSDFFRRINCSGRLKREKEGFMPKPMWVAELTNLKTGDKEQFVAETTAELFALIERSQLEKTA